MNKAVKYLSHALGWLRYVVKFKRIPSLSEPHDLNEKILWLSRHSDLSVWTRLSDKYLVREYVKERGLEEILVPMYQHCKSVDDIDFDSLPQQFVIKPTSGSGNVVVVNDKSKVSAETVRNKLKNGTSRWFGFATGEPHYLDIKNSYVVEVLLPSEGSHGVVDYKIWCFNGKAQACLVCADRNIDKHKVSVVSYSLPDWQRHPERIYGRYKNDVEVARPRQLERMIEISEKLSAGIPCVRVDLYEVGDKVYFGEMTFTSNGGRMRYFTDEYLLDMGQCLDVKK